MKKDQYFRLKASLMVEAQRAPQGRFTSFDQPIEKNRIEKNTAVAMAADDAGLFEETNLRPSNSTTAPQCQ